MRFVGRFRGFPAAVLLICLLFGTAAFPFRAEADFPGTQDEKYPQILTDDYLAALAKEKIEETLASQGETRRYTLMLSRKVNPMRCPPGVLICEAELPKDLRYGGLNPVNMKVYVDGALFREIVCYYELHVFGSMLVAARDLRLEQVLTPADIRLEEHEVESNSEFYLEDPEKVIGMVPSRVIRSGTPLTEKLLQTPIVIEVGATVQIVTNYKGIQVKTEGVALQRGRVGKIIRVRNAASSKILRGRVIDASTVEIL